MVEPFRKKEQEKSGRGIYIRKPRKDILDIHKTNFTAVALVLGIVLFIFLLSKFTNPEYTSFISQGSNKVGIGETFYKGSILYISTNDNQVLPLRSVKLSGNVIGEGNISIYLVAQKAEWLIYTNRGKKFEVPEITGFVVSDILGQKQGIVDNDVLKSSSENQVITERKRYIDASQMVFETDKNVETLELDIIESQDYKESFEKAVKKNIIEINNECKDTCILDSQIRADLYTIRFDMDEGMAFNLTSLEIY